MLFNMRTYEENLDQKYRLYEDCRQPEKTFKNNIFQPSSKGILCLYTPMRSHGDNFQESRYLYNLYVVVTKRLKAAPEPIHQ